MQLRYYQQDAVAACYRYLAEKDGNPCIVIPTGGGKTPVIATIARDVVGRWGGRILILAHVKELLQQAADKLAVIAPEMADKVGVYSAGLNSRETSTPVVIAGIQSVFRRAAELGAFDLVLIDEAHLIPPDGEGMYRTFLAAAREINPAVRLIGLTATPYRLNSGLICSPENLLNEICYEVGVKELIAGGFLSRLVSKAAAGEVNADDLHVRGGDFIPAEAEALMTADKVVEVAVEEIVRKTADRRSVLIFCAGVRHAEQVRQEIAARGLSVEAVYGDTLAQFRDEAIAKFKAGEVKYLVNVAVLTTGFDAPETDCVVLLRPTQSPGLYYQMCGRGFRIAEGKKNCLILDFGGNVQRHGPLDMIEPHARRKREHGDGKSDAPPTKKCPECGTVVLRIFTVCPECGHAFPAIHDAYAATDGLLSGEVSEEEYEVSDVWFSVHEKKDAPPGAPRTVQVEYFADMTTSFREWVCPEHSGYARTKFEKWWRELAGADSPLPADAEEAAERARDEIGPAVVGVRIRRVSGEKYPRVVGVMTEDPDKYGCNNLPPEVPKAYSYDPQAEGVPF